MSVGYMKKCVNGKTGQPKRKYLTQSAAEEVREEFIKRGIWARSRSNTYRCGMCNSFHAGEIRVQRGTGRKNKKHRDVLWSQ